TTADAPKLFGCQLRARKQYLGETANIFASKFRLLAKQAYPTFLPNQLEPILRDCFLFGLRPELQTRMIDKETRNFDDAVRIATNIEMNIKFIQPAMGIEITSPTSTANSHSDIVKMPVATPDMSQIQTQLDTIRSMLSSGQTPKEPTTSEMSQIRTQLDSIRTLMAREPTASQ